MPRLSTICSRVLVGAALLLLTATSQAYFDALAPWAEQLNLNLNAEFSAKRTTQVDDETFSGDIHRAPQKTLMGMNYQGMQAQLLTREDLGKFYVLMPQMGMYREVPRTEALQQQMQAGTLEQVRRVGRDTVNGMNVTVYDVRYRDEDGVGDGRLSVSDAGVLVKMEVTHQEPGQPPQRYVDTLSDVRMARQDPATFELPPNLRPLDMGAMMGLGAAMQGLNNGAAPGAAPGDAQPPSAEDVQAQMQRAMEEIQRALRQAEESGSR